MWCLRDGGQARASHNAILPWIWTDLAGAPTISKNFGTPLSGTNQFATYIANSSTLCLKLFLVAVQKSYELNLFQGIYYIFELHPQHRGHPKAMGKRKQPIEGLEFAAMRCNESVIDWQEISTIKFEMSAIKVSKWFKWLGFPRRTQWRWLRRWLWGWRAERRCTYLPCTLAGWPVNELHGLCNFLIAFYQVYKIDQRPVGKFISNNLKIFMITFHRFGFYDQGTASNENITGHDIYHQVDHGCFEFFSEPSQLSLNGGAAETQPHGPWTVGTARGLDWLWSIW